MLIKISGLVSGTAGSRTCAAVADYALNTGRVFIGDPASMTTAAALRSTEAMLSSALKHSTTPHIEPGLEQMEGDAALGIPPFKWTKGDHSDNLQDLIRVSLASLSHQVPEFNDVEFDFTTFTFRTTGGRWVSDRELENTAAKARGDGKAGIGRATLKRGALLNTLIRAESRKRPGFLGVVLRQPGQLVELGLARTFYRRTGGGGRGANDAFGVGGYSPAGESLDLYRKTTPIPDKERSRLL